MSEATRNHNAGKSAAVKLAAATLLFAAIGIRFAAQPKLPVDVVQTRHGFADEQSCVGCHREIVQAYQDNGHRHTLRRGDSPHSIRNLRELTLTDPATGGDVAVDLSGVYPRAIHKDPAGETAVVLDWCFGSGQHALTWTGSLPGSWGETEMLEFRWTRYSLIDDFAVTPGQPAHPEPGYFAGLGAHKDPSRTRRCFACHASYVPVQGDRIDYENLEAGINCQRCHGPMQNHVALARAGKPSVDDFWRSATPLEAINRCGQCHRRTDEFPAEDIRPDNPLMARFQPVGLSQSACFTRSESMTCTTCHDPHKPLRSQDAAGAWQCVQCHDPVNVHGSVGCALGRTDGCVGCHMPKIKQEAPLEFTDHWIRVLGVRD